MELNDNEELDFERERFKALYTAFSMFDRAAKKGDELPLLSEEEYGFVVDEYVRNGNDTMAEVAAEEGFAAYPYSLDLLVKYCDSLVVQKELEEALDVLNDYRDSFPPSSEIYLSYSRIFIGKKKIKLARQYYEKAIDIEEFPEEICDSVHTLAQDCMENEEFKEAIFYLDRAKELSKMWSTKNSKAETPENLATMYFDYAYCSEKVGDIGNSIKYYNQYLDIDPFSDAAWYNIGTMYAKLADLKKAQEAFEYAVALNKENSSALYNLAIVYVNTDEYDKAISTFNDFLNIEKGNIEGIIGLADCYIAINNLKQAEILLRKALMLDPSCKEAAFGLKAIEKLKKDNTEDE